MSDFRPLNENELDNRSSDELIDYIRAADAAGDTAAAELALSILVFRHYDDVVRRAKIKIPTADVEDVAMEAVTSAIRSAFDGEAIGQFISWLNTIVDRRIADYHRKRESRPDEQPYPEEHSDAEEIWGESGSVTDDTGVVDAQDVIDSCLEKLNKVHRKVVELYVFDDQSADDAANQVNKMFDGHADLPTPMTTDNVHKIKSRFSRCVRGMLDDSED